MSDAEREPTSPLSPIALYPPHPQSTRSRGGRAPEFYGFVAWLSTSLAWVVFLLWALCSDDWIIATGVSWYPSREWALLLPAWSVMLFIFAYVAYSSLALSAIPAFSDFTAIIDTRAHILKASPNQPEQSPSLLRSLTESVPVPYELPVGLVNRVVYGKRRRRPRYDA